MKKYKVATIITTLVGLVMAGTMISSAQADTENQKTLNRMADVVRQNQQDLVNNASAYNRRIFIETQKGYGGYEGMDVRYQNSEYENLSQTEKQSIENTVRNYETSKKLVEGLVIKQPQYKD